MTPLVVVYCLLFLLLNKQFHASFIHKNRSRQFSSALVLSVLRNSQLESDVCRLPFAVNVTLNLPSVSFKFRMDVKEKTSSFM